MSDEHLYLAEAAKELGVGTSRLATLIRNGRVYPERPSSEKPYRRYIRGAIVESMSNQPDFTWGNV